MIKQAVYIYSTNLDYKLYHFFWIGLRLKKDADSRNITASWTDGTSVDYGQPDGNSTGQTPWAAGSPWISRTQLYNDYCTVLHGGDYFQGKTGEWRDTNCNMEHVIATELATGRPIYTAINGYICAKDAFSVYDTEAEEACASRNVTAAAMIASDDCPDGWKRFEGKCFKV